MSAPRTKRPARAVPSLLALLSLVGAGLALHLGCAEERYGAVKTTWDQAEANAGPTVATPPSPDAKPKKTAADVARETRGGDDCAALARDIYPRDPHAGEVLLKECVERADYYSLDLLLGGPWIKSVKTSEAFQQLVARVIGRRGGFVEQDVKSARTAGVGLLDVDGALKLGPKAIGKVVLVRGHVASSAWEKWGTSKSLVARVSETTWAEAADDSGTIGIREAPEATGRTIFVRLERKDPRFTEDHTFVFMVRVEGPRSYTAHSDDNEGEEQKSIIGTGVAAFDSSDKLRN